MRSLQVEMVDCDTGKVLDTYESITEAAFDLMINISFLRKLIANKEIIDGIYYRTKEKTI